MCCAKNMKVFFNTFVVFLITLNSFLSFVNCVRLRGVALQSNPFINKYGTQFEGYIIDVLNAMKNISDFDYYLYDTNQLGTVNRKAESYSGLLGEVFTNRADFGITGVEVKNEYRKYVAYTDPVLNYSISALVKRSVIGKIRTFEDLADTQIIYGGLRNSSTMKLFQESNKMVDQRMYTLMKSSITSVGNIDEALERVQTEANYAFIDDSYVVEELAQKDCSLTVIHDYRPYFRRQIALILPQGSKYLAIFNQFIKQLVDKGKIADIQAKYWNRRCGVNGVNKSVVIENSLIALSIVLCFLFVF